MEVILNLIWTALAVAAVIHFSLRRPRRLEPRSVGNLPCALALGCALILLFPVISVTDDLHPDAVAVDASAGKRASFRLPARQAHRSGEGNRNSQVCALSPPPHYTVVLSECGFVDNNSLFAAIAGALQAPNSRAPPSA